MSALNTPALHRTDYNSALQILNTGFDLRKFGSATKKTGQANNFKYHARGIFLSEDGKGTSPKDFAAASVGSPRPWRLHLRHGEPSKKPMDVNLHMDGVFYQQWLSEKFGDRVKAQLTTAMQQEGYDGIYVRDAGEITVFDPDSFAIDTKKSQESIQAYTEWKSVKGAGFKEWLSILETGR